MPGHIIHLAAASCILANSPMGECAANEFLLGSIVPDILERSNKKQSHFWSDEGFEKFERVPDLDAFCDKYGNQMSNPFVLGYYCHLYMDALFMRTSWKRHFSFFDKDMQANDLYDEVAFIGYRKHTKDDISVYPREEFFSNAYYYGDYDRVNPYIVKNYNIRIPRLPSEDIAYVEGVLLKANDERMARMIEAANQFKNMPVEHITYDSTDKQLKVFLLSEFQYLIEETVNETKKYI